MLAVNYTCLRDNMKRCMDQVTDDYETLIVTRKNNKNVVMMSEEMYNNLMENVHIVSSKANFEWLMQSKQQLAAGNFSQHAPDPLYSLPVLHGRMSAADPDPGLLCDAERKEGYPGLERSVLLQCPCAPRRQSL